MDEEPGGRLIEDDDESSLKIFLIADIRGYTRFTQERGDEAAGKLAAKFATIARDAITAARGTLLELRGDEALAVFDSARQALRTAVSLQQLFVIETQWSPELPLPVGIGVDVGEAVRVESGYRGRALNLAARLCSAAGPGEILASTQVVHLAGTIDDVRFEERPALTLKGMEKPVAAVQVRPQGEDPAQQLRALGVLKPPAEPKRPRGRRRLIAAVAAAVAVAVVTAAVVVVSSDGGSTPIAPDSAAQLDATDGHVLAQFSLPGSPDGIAVVGRTVWTTSRDRDSVGELDTETHNTQTIKVESQPTGIAATDGSVWVANTFSGTVSRINIGSGTVVQRIPVGASPAGIAADHDGVWVANTAGATVTRIDPSRGSVLATVAVGQARSDMAIGKGAVWVANSADGTVSKIDLGGNSVVGTFPVGREPLSVAVTSDAVWTANTLDGTVSRLDPSTGSVTSTLPVGGIPDSVTAAGDDIWVADRHAGSITRISDGKLEAPTPLGSAPAAVASSGQDLWVATQPALAAHKGGTLRIAEEARITSLDPADPLGFYVFPILNYTNDPLVTFNRTGGAAGALLVPDLATAIPTPTDGGRTYTFQLRRGIRYSSGVPLRPSDVPATFERMVKEHSGGGYYDEIVGMKDCTPKSCDLSRGIVADDDNGTVTFHLTHPDGDFLYTLALVLVVPKGTPAPANVVPGTGPYMLDGKLGKTFDLVRNPHFRAWSPLAQPAGLPDRMRWITGILVKHQAKAIQEGRVDWAYGAFLPADQLSTLRVRFPTLLHEFPTPSTKGIFFNVRVPPFNSEQARQAVNFAVDRGRAVRAIIHNGGTPQCQILPPNFPGYRPYCPYTVHPDASGAWHGPDVAKARRLVAASGTKGTPVTLIIHEGDENIGRFAASLLTKLGWPTKIKNLPFDEWLGYVMDTRSRAQAGLFGWFADYPSAADFLNTLFSCEHLVLGDPFRNTNVSEFCDPTVQRRIHAAVAAQASARPSAAAAWARIDREIVDRAIWAPIWDITAFDFVSSRVHNYQNNPELGMLLDQLWLK
jgi:YVTN family beta-propeller protein